MRATLRIALSVLALGVAAAIGFAAGNHRTFDWMLEVQATEVRGNLNYNLATASLVRQGELDKALRALDVRVDAAMSSLPRGREWEDLPEGDQLALVVAKRYREAYPPVPMPAELRQAIDWIPDIELDPASCDPAVRHLLEKRPEQ